MDWCEDFFDPLPNLDNLGAASSRMRFQFAAFGPVICLVVMIPITQQQPFFGAIDDVRISRLTRIDQKFLSLTRSGLWKLKPGLVWLIFRSKAVVLTAFCSPPVNLDKVVMIVAAIMNCIISPCPILGLLRVFQ